MHAVERAVGGKSWSRHLARYLHNVVELARAVNVSGPLVRSVIFKSRSVTVACLQYDTACTLELYAASLHIVSVTAHSVNLVILLRRAAGLCLDSIRWVLVLGSCRSQDRTNTQLPISNKAPRHRNN